MGTIVGGVESKWIYDARDQYIAVASGRIDGEWEEVMANAYLIAAAPDLYEALRVLLPVCEEAMSAPEYRSEVERQALKDAYAAIAKAEGREP